MFMKQDWFMRQIEVLAAAIAQLVFGKGEAAHEIREEAREGHSDQLRRRLTELIDQGRLGEAEDLLFQQLEPENRDTLALALDFYQRLNALSDQALEAGNFSREEIWEGLEEAAGRFGLCLPGLLEGT